MSAAETLIPSSEIANDLLGIATQLSARQCSYWRKVRLAKGQGFFRAFWMDSPEQPQLGMISHVECSARGLYAGVWAARFVLLDERGPFSTVVKQEFDAGYTDYDLDILDTFETYLAKYDRPHYWAQNMTRDQIDGALTKLCDGDLDDLETRRFFLAGV